MIHRVNLWNSRNYSKIYDVNKCMAIEWVDNFIIDILMCCGFALHLDWVQFTRISFSLFQCYTLSYLQKYTHTHTTNTFVSYRFFYVRTFVYSTTNRVEWTEQQFFSHIFHHFSDDIAFRKIVRSKKNKFIVFKKLKIFWDHVGLGFGDCVA